VAANGMGGSECPNPNLRDSCHHRLSQHALNYSWHGYLWMYFDSVIMNNGSCSFKRYLLNIYHFTVLCEDL
jgi:hypothetical protein